MRRHLEAPARNNDQCLDPFIKNWMYKTLMFLYIIVFFCSLFIKNLGVSFSSIISSLQDSVFRKFRSKVSKDPTTLQEQVLLNSKKYSTTSLIIYIYRYIVLDFPLNPAIFCEKLAAVHFASVLIFLRFNHRSCKACRLRLGFFHLFNRLSYQPII